MIEPIHAIPSLFGKIASQRMPPTTAATTEADRRHNAHVLLARHDQSRERADDRPRDDIDDDRSDSEIQLGDHTQGLLPYRDQPDGHGHWTPASA